MEIDEQYSQFINDLKLSEIIRQKKELKVIHQDQLMKRKEESFKERQENSNQTGEMQQQYSSQVQKVESSPVTIENIPNNQAAKQVQIQQNEIKMIGQIKGLYRLAKDFGYSNSTVQPPNESIVVLDDDSELKQKEQSISQNNNETKNLEKDEVVGQTLENL